MIVLEGPDLSGKSTIMNLFREATGLPSHHFGPPPKTKDEILNRIECPPPNVVFDRHPCISEQVYSILRLEGQLLSSNELTERFLEMNPLVVFCDPGIDYLLSKMHFLKAKAHKSTDHVGKVEQNYRHIYARYQGLMHNIGQHIMVKRIDFRTIKIAEVKQIIKEYEERLK